MVELLVNGQHIDLEEGQDIKMTFQTHDIADVSSVNATYTNSFKAPKTPNNTQIMEGLGYVGDTSTIPYSKVTGQLLEYGLPVIPSGWTTIKNTDSNYNLYLQSGIIDFFKAIENKKFGSDIDLSEINHIKNVETVIDSQTNENYRYLVGDYGGKIDLVFPENPTTHFTNIDYLVPSARVKYLWDKVFDYAEFTYSGEIFSDENFTNAWISFNKSNSEVDADLVITYEQDEWNPIWIFNVSTYEVISDSPVIWDSITVTQSGVVSNQVQPDRLAGFKILQDGNFQLKINFDATGIYRYRRYDLVQIFVDIESRIKLRVYRNGTSEDNWFTLSDGEDKIISFPAVAGDLITFKVFGLTQQELWSILPQDPKPDINAWWFYEFRDLLWGSLKVDVSEVEFMGTDFNDNFKDMNPKDFMKEVMVRFGLTPIVDNIARHITFYKISELLNRSNYIDWSDRYKSRKNELYTFGNYAQLNYLKHKYREEGLPYADGVIQVNNQNLNDEATLFSSKFFAPDNEVSQLRYLSGGLLVKRTLIWEDEVKEQEDGTFITEYKPQNGRYYWLKSEIVNKNILFGSVVLGESEMTEFFHKASTSFSTFDDLVPIYYDGYQWTLNNSRMHTIELDLSVADIINLDFTKMYYFSQEQSFYRLNKLTYQGGKPSTGEFIKINF